MAKGIKDSQINYLIQKITNLFSNKVDKVEGKDLSTHDYNDEEKSKLASIENNATNNEIVIKTWTSADIQ